MVVMYEVFGRKVGSHVLAMATLGTVFAGGAYGLSGGKKDDKNPPINASSKDEENFVKKFISDKEGDKSKQ